MAAFLFIRSHLFFFRGDFSQYRVLSPKFEDEGRERMSEMNSTFRAQGLDFLSPTNEKLEPNLILFLANQPLFISRAYIPGSLLE